MGIEQNDDGDEYLYKVWLVRERRIEARKHYVTYVVIAVWLVCLFGAYVVPALYAATGR